MIESYLVRLALYLVVFIASGFGALYLPVAVSEGAEVTYINTALEELRQSQDSQLLEIDSPAVQEIFEEGRDQGLKEMRRFSNLSVVLVAIGLFILGVVYAPATYLDMFFVSLPVLVNAALQFSVPAVSVAALVLSYGGVFVRRRLQANNR